MSDKRKFLEDTGMRNLHFPMRVLSYFLYAGKVDKDD
jgi:hypothetical protein